MLFQNSTPQTVAAYIAVQESRKASKRKSAHGSDMEPSITRQKLLHGSKPPVPASAPAPSQANATTCLGPTDEEPKLVDASLPPAQAQSREMTDLRPTTGKQKRFGRSVAPIQGHAMAKHGMATQKPESDHSSLPPAQVQAHDNSDLGPPTKKPNLSYASLPPGRRTRVEEEMSSAEYAHADAEYYRKRLRRWCTSHGFDYHLLDQSILSDTLLMSPNFDLYKYMATQSSKVNPYAYGPPELDVYPFHESSVENLMAETPGLETHSIPRQKIHCLSRHSPAPNRAVPVRPVSGEVPHHYTTAQNPITRMCSVSGHETSHPPLFQDATATASLAFGGKINEACPLLGNQTSALLSSIRLTPQSPGCSFSDPNVGYDTTYTSSDRIASVGPDRDAGDDTAATSSDQSAPLSPDSSFRNDTTFVSSSESPSVGPARNKGGRPRQGGRKPRAPKTPKGPTRFQKNHPIKATVNIDVWENILVFCPPDFLLKARTISATFRSVLKDDSPIWKRARVNHFGPDLPDPPLGLSEPQYADLVTGIGCQTRGCTSTKTRKTYWAMQKRMCIECFQKSFLPPRALRRVFKELETSETPQYHSIAQYYRRMDDFLPGMKFDRWDNYQWLGDYDPTPSWGQLYRSGQYTAYPAVAYADFSSELAAFVGNEYDVEHGQFFSNEPMPGKTCPSQDAIDAWFEAKRAANDALVPKLQAVEDWYESCKRDNQKMGMDLRKNRESFYEEQAELAGWNKAFLKASKSYQAAIAISKPPTKRSWEILQPKIMAEHEAAKNLLAEQEAERANRAMELYLYGTRYPILRGENGIR